MSTFIVQNKHGRALTSIEITHYPDGYPIVDIHGILGCFVVSVTQDVLIELLKQDNVYGDDGVTELGMYAKEVNEIRMLALKHPNDRFVAGHDVDEDTDEESCSRCHVEHFTGDGEQIRMPCFKHENDGCRSLPGEESTEELQGVRQAIGVRSERVLSV
jgi:hypothetical protein